MLLDFKAPGPVSAAFIAARDPLDAIMGPMGSGKTSACIMRSVQRAAEIPRSRVTGERLYKLGVVRNTLADMKRTTMKSVEGWFGEKGKWGGGGSSSEPPYFKVGFKLADGSVARLWYDFVGLDTHSVEQLAKGWEITDFWLNEGDLLPQDVWEFVDGRTGRYPGAQHCDLPFYGGMADYNAPDTENYAYTLFEELRPPGARLFRQPGGRDPKAENLANLPTGYYDRLAQNKSDWWIRRNIDCQYGYSREGKPVYGEYRDDFHCAAVELLPVPGLVVKVDFDQGLRPACILRQTMPNGQLRVLDELYCETGAQGLCELLKRLIGSARYAGFRVVGGRCDPAANARDANDAESWVDCVNRLMAWRGGQMVRVADTNEPDKRQAAVRMRLKQNVDDGRPGLLISPTCRVLRKGFNSDYHFKKIRAAGGETHEHPEKKFPAADVHDALQYGALDDGGYEEVVGREARSHRPFGGKTFQAKMAVRL